jgi:hypothetical protein
MDAAFAGGAHGQRLCAEVRPIAPARRRALLACLLVTAVVPTVRARAASSGLLSRGSSGPQDAVPSRVLTVGRGREFATIAAAARAARDRDIVEIDAGDYVDDVAVWSQSHITIRSAGGPVRIASVARTAEGKAIFVIKGAGVVVEGIEFSGAATPSRNGSGIRHEGAMLTVRDCVFDRNEMGLLTWNSPSAELVVERCEFRHNAVKGLYQPGGRIGHQLYAGSIRRLALRDSYIHAGAYGHLVKSRARENHILCNRLTDEAGGRASYELEFPNGGVAYVIGNVIAQGPLTDNEAMIGFGAEGYSSDTNELYLVNNTLFDELPGGGEFVRARPDDSLRLLALNNVLIGDGRFVADTGGRTGNVRLRPSEVVDAAAYDMHLRGDAWMSSRAVDPGEANGVSLRQSCEYRHPRNSVEWVGAPAHPGACQIRAR